MSRKPGERSVGLAVFGGFVLGAATVLLIVWAYGVRWRGQPEVAVTSPAPAPPVATPPAPTPAAPPLLPTVTPKPTPQPLPAPPARQPDPEETADLARRQLLLPVQGVRPEALQDTFADARSGGARSHEALDIAAPRNTPILAVEDGKVAKLFTSKLGGLTVYQFDPTATYAYYYAHLERYAEGLKEGDPVRRGQVLGYVGTSGDAPPDAPHLHFAIMRLTPEKHWWQGTALNPYPILRQGGAAATPTK
jgi:murein DD-endopeptidase MepM/ murein hydrolase activator NlpD